MNPEQLLLEIEDLMEQARRIGIQSAHLCHYDYSLAIRRADHSKVPHPVLYKFTRRELYEGLTPKQWNELSRKVLNFEKDQRK